MTEPRDGPHDRPAGIQSPGSVQPEPASEAELRERLRALGQRVEALEGEQTVVDRSSTAREATAGIGRAFRLSSEFFAGIVAGGGLGWLVDRVFGTQPWGMIVLFLLGFVAGIMNVVRASGSLGNSVENDRSKPDA